MPAASPPTAALPGSPWAASLRGYVVVYGGSFDPPHVSHQLSCLYLLATLGAEAVWVVPSFNHPFGKDLTPFDDRLALCEAMAAPLRERVRVLAIERTLAGAGRTYDTLAHLAASHPDQRLALAIGSDILDDTPRWHRWDDIVSRFPVAVIGRAGYPHPACPVELPALASHRLRERARRGVPLTGLVPVAVADEIARRGLYRPAASP